VARVLGKAEVLSGDRSTGDRLERQRSMTITPTTTTTTMNAPEQPSSIAMNVSPLLLLLLLPPPPPLMAITADDLCVGVTDVRQTSPAVSRDLPVSPEHKFMTASVYITRNRKQRILTKGRIAGASWIFHGWGACNVTPSSREHGQGHMSKFKVT